MAGTGAGAGGGVPQLFRALAVGASVLVGALYTVGAVAGSIHRRNSALKRVRMRNMENPVGYAKEEAIIPNKRVETCEKILRGKLAVHPNLVIGISHLRICRRHR
nr:uncharacterized protein LOC109162895 [Ipomoea batatas]